MNETTNGGDGGIWDRIWRGRASSHRRNLANVAAETARIATLIVEAARLVDHLPGENRTVEIHGVCDEIVSLTESILATVDHLRAEAGAVTYALQRPGIFGRLARWILGE